MVHSGEGGVPRNANSDFNEAAKAGADTRITHVASPAEARQCLERRLRRQLAEGVTVGHWTLEKQPPVLRPPWLENTARSRTEVLHVTVGRAKNLHVKVWATKGQSTTQGEINFRREVFRDSYSLDLGPGRTNQCKRE